MMKKPREMTTAPLKPQQVRVLLSSLQGRDKLLMAVGVYAGLRGNEILKLKWEDLLEDGVTSVWQSKTKKTRKIWKPKPLVGVIQEVYSGQNPEELAFLPKKGGRGYKPMTVTGLNKIIKKNFAQFGVSTANESSHCLRKTFGRAYFESNGRDFEALLWLQRYFGHSTIQTTIIYIGVEFETQMQKVENISYS